MALYDKYNTNNIFKFHGEYAFVILVRFTSQSTVKLEDEGAQSEYMCCYGD